MRIRAITTFKTSANFDSNGRYAWPLWIAAAVEIDVGVICACAPALKTLLYFSRPSTRLSNKISATKGSDRYTDTASNPNPARHDNMALTSFRSSGHVKGSIMLRSQEVRDTDEWQNTRKDQMRTQCESTMVADLGETRRRSGESAEATRGIMMEQTFEMASVRSTGTASMVSHESECTCV